MFKCVHEGGGKVVMTESAEVAKKFAAQDCWSVEELPSAEISLQEEEGAETAEPSAHADESTAEEGDRAHRRRRR